MTFSGIYTPLITPFKGDQINEAALRQQIERQEEAGVSGLVVLGTTGEAAALSDEEKERILSIAAESSLQLIVGCSGSSTKKIIEAVSHFEAADALMISAPAYTRPTQEGIYQHFVAAATATDLPIIVYNIPSRSGVNIEPSTLEKLSLIDNIVALKECNRDQVRRGRLTLLCGDDASILSMMALGAQGAIASSANIIPAEMVRLVQLCLANDFEAARTLFYQLLPLFEAGSWESNPIPCKAMMDLLGLEAGEPRLPLLPCTKIEELRRLLCKLGYLEAVDASRKPIASC